MSPETDKTIDIDYLRQWVGKEQVVADDMSRFKAEALSAALHDERSPLSGECLEDSLPAGWQWLYFLDTPIASDMGDDGHPKTGGFLPPVPLPRRMWAAAIASASRPSPHAFFIARSSFPSTAPPSGVQRVIAS